MAKCRERTRTAQGPRRAAGTVRHRGTAPRRRSPNRTPTATTGTSTPANGRWSTSPASNVTWISAAGDMISTTEDLHTFFSALMSGKLLPHSLLTEMRTPHPELGYSLGVFVEETNGGGIVLRHNGGYFGWAALMHGRKDQLAAFANWSALCSQPLMDSMCM
ncbi:serine hydrolase [Streptomyces decoyicus]|uniref:serine hydrolase n=1 Tax=Streptomyces decoyicus TaxID=249567 RepID=UPI00363C2B10